jgi:ketopantoate reductase
MMQSVVSEIAATAAASGITLPAGNPPMDLVATVLDETAANTSSMLSDLQRGNVTEIGQIVGPILEAASCVGVHTPVLSTLATLVKAKHPPTEGGAGAGDGGAW